MPEGTLLFGRGSLTDPSSMLANDLAAKVRDVQERLRRWEADDLLNTPAEVVVDDLLGTGTMDCPQLLTDKVWLKPVTEIGYESFEFGDRVTRRAARHVLVVPFDGVSAVFTRRASTSSLNPPRVLRVDARELHLFVDNPPGDGAALRALFDDQIEKVEKHLAWSRQDIDVHNRQLRENLPIWVEARRNEISASRKIQSDTGYPTSPPGR